MARHLRPLPSAVPVDIFFDNSFFFHSFFFVAASVCVFFSFLFLLQKKIVRVGESFVGADGLDGAVASFVLFGCEAQKKREK